MMAVENINVDYMKPGEGPSPFSVSQNVTTLDI